MKLNHVGLIFVLIGAFLLSGCSYFGWQRTPVLAVPTQVSYEDEIKLAQLSQQLGRRDLDDNSLVQILYQRGMLYDQLGFNAFAQSDFSQVLNIRKDVPEIYNFLGTYAVQQGDLDSAYMAFNTALELDKDHEFAYFNRGLALYRGERYESAQNDLLKFYQYSPNDPMRLLWLYIVENEINPQEARKDLQQRFDLLENKQVWGTDIVAFYLGQMSESDLSKNVPKGVADNQELAKRLCEMYFYLGKYYLNKGDVKRAETLFKYTLANNIYNYIEHQQALQELVLLENKE